MTNQADTNVPFDTPINVTAGVLANIRTFLMRVPTQNAEEAEALVGAIQTLNTAFQETLDSFSTPTAAPVETEEE